MALRDATNAIKTVTDPAATLFTVASDSVGFHIVNNHATQLINISINGTASATTFVIVAGAGFQKEGEAARPYRKAVISAYAVAPNNAVSVLDVGGNP